MDKISVQNVVNSHQHIQFSLGSMIKLNLFKQISYMNLE